LKTRIELRLMRVFCFRDVKRHAVEGRALRFSYGLSQAKIFSSPRILLNFLPLFSFAGTECSVIPHARASSNNRGSSCFTEKM
jgi:hypothetical protein